MWTLDKERVAQVLSSSVTDRIPAKCLSLEKMVQVYKITMAKKPFSDLNKRNEYFKVEQKVECV